MDKPIVVVVDQDESSLARFRDPSPKEMIQFALFKARPEAQLFLAEKKNFVSGLVVNGKSCPPHGTSLIRFSKMHRPATPVYLMLEEGEAEPEAELLKGLHIAGIFHKPLDRQDVIAKVFPYSYFEFERALEVAKNDDHAVNATVSAADQEMHPILAKDFLCGSKSFFDVYVRLAAGRYVKLLKAGDSFDAERVRDYLEKGVAFFYIKKEAQEVFLQYCDSLTGIVLHKKETPMDLKVSQVMNYGKETEDFLKNRGFNEATLLTAKQFVHHTEKLVAQLKPEKNPVLRKFLSNVVLCEHGTGMTIMTGMMLEALNIKDEKVLNTLALAAFMHDIGLVNMPELHHEDESIMNPEDFKRYISHPIIGYEMAKSIRMINPIVPATILEHHERRTGQGFPYARGSGSITQIAEVIGIVDKFVQVVKQNAKNPDANILLHMQKRVYNEFSFSVIEAFDKTFLKTLSQSA